MRSNAAQVAKAIRARPARFERELDRAFNRIGQRKLQLVRKRFTSYAPGRRPNKLMKRSGSLARSFAARQIRRGGIEGMGVALQTDHPAARIQELGGTIRAKPGRYLAVPTSAALTPTGRLKAMAVLRRSGDKWVNSNDEPTFIRNGVIYVTRKSRKKPIPIRFLTKSVTITDRLGVREMHKRMMVRYIPEQIRKAAERALAA